MNPPSGAGGICEKVIINSKLVWPVRVWGLVSTD